jgi:hypothetical protein
MDIIFIVESDILACGNLTKWISLNFDFQICANGILPKTAFCLAPYDLHKRIGYLRYNQYCLTTEIQFQKGKSRTILVQNGMWDQNSCTCKTIVPERIQKYKKRGYTVLIGSYEEYIRWKRKVYDEEEEE